MAEYGLRLLHLSDLHLGKAGAGEAWRSRRVLDDAWLEHLDAIRADGRPIDLVCFTGDVAQSGQRPQYELATEFFRETLERLQVDPSRFFVIPGNHDVDRTVNRADWSGLRKKLRPEDGGTWPGGFPAVLPHGGSATRSGNACWTARRNSGVGWATTGSVRTCCHRTRRTVVWAIGAPSICPDAPSRSK